MLERKSQRLTNYDYSRPGFYFVTVTLDNKKYTFGDIVEGMMRLNALGDVVKKCWHEIPNHFDNCKLDVFVVMPDHVHGIIEIFGNNAIVGNRPRSFGVPYDANIRHYRLLLEDISLHHPNRSINWDIMISNGINRLMIALSGEMNWIVKEIISKIIQRIKIKNPLHGII